MLMNESHSASPENEVGKSNNSHVSAGKHEVVLQKEEPASQSSLQTGTSMTESTKPTESTVTSAPVPVVIQQSGGKGLAIGALVLAILGLGASGFLFVQGQNVLRNQELSFNQKMDKAAVGDSQNAVMLQDSLRKQAEFDALMVQLNKNQQENGEQIAQTQRAYQELLKSRSDWLVDEVEATLNLASQQLLISGNVPVAVTVLENIENRLNRFEQADLLPIKQAISSDLAELKNRPYLDVSGASLRLNRLEVAASSLPLVVDSTLQPTKEAASANTSVNSGWWQNAWNKTINNLQGMIEVRKLNSSDAMLLSPEQVYFVRENLRLRLLDARVALMQHNGEVYLNDLNSLETTVKQYFDTQSPATQAWLKEIAELKAVDIRMASSDALKASLTAVRHYQDSVRSHNNQTVVISATAKASAPTVNETTTKPAQATASVPTSSAASAAAASVPEKAASAIQPNEKKASESAKVKGAQA